ncbi:MAG: flagellar basal-body rod protein FlgC [Chlamydiales bacterium]|jgi:flagellar basal-body rod protein FlgC|nr:flagellar basal-body rod protein FlgC [Chlamydiales bacterium]
MATNTIFRSQAIAASGLKSARNWMNTIANNLANALTVDTGQLDKSGNYVPYHRQVPVFKKMLEDKIGSSQSVEEIEGGVEVEKVVSLKNQVRKVYDPTHPAARKMGSVDAGYVYYPEVDPTQEKADADIASAYYEANLAVLSDFKRMIEETLRLARRA